MTVKERIEMLTIPTGEWSCSDIAKYFNWSRTKAYSFCRKIETNPLSFSNCKRYSIDYVLSLFGKQRIKEINLLKKIKEI